MRLFRSFESVLDNLGRPALGLIAKGTLLLELPINLIDFISHRTHLESMSTFVSTLHINNVHAILEVPCYSVLLAIVQIKQRLML